MSGGRLSAVELAGVLGLPEPTGQQRAVIEAPLAPALVVAGAGSGKTETMAGRVTWLVANGLVAPQDVLGLTFTRKAAASLAERLGRRMHALREHGLIPEADEAGADVFGAEPMVATYNAFASSFSREHALAIGREPDAEVIGEAASWQLARRVVVEHGDARLARLDVSVDRAASIVLDLARAVSDNVADVDAVRAFAQRFGALAELPYGGRGKSTPYASVVKAVADVGALDPLLDLVVAYREAKRRRGVVEFSDQVALALAVCERSPDAVALARDRHRVVLLDEYQDTSVVQSRLLAALFRGTPIMAVGDPNQSIYGWRGASAANLGRFGADFGSEAGGERRGADFGAGGDVPVYPLSTSWRNAGRILTAANALAAPLRAASAVAVEPLEARPGAPEGEIELRFTETVDEEAAAVAAWCRDRLAEPRADGVRMPEAAILFRRRAPMARFAEALAELGVPHVVVGLGGLLETPEVTDVLCALRVLVDAEAGSELIRLLAGPVWRIGVRDLAALERIAAWLHDRDVAGRLLDPELLQRRRASAAADDGRSLVDALDFVVDAPVGHSALAALSEEGLVRLRDAGARFRRLRMRLGLPLPELVRILEQELGLDLETVANDGSAVGAGNLRAFHDELDAFLRVDDRGTVSSLLSWVDRARDAESLAPADVDPVPGAVQLLTVHASKGLEWDAVAVPRLVADEFPGRPREGLGWVRVGALPYEFRGDAAELPVLAWRSAETQKDVDTGLAGLKTALAARQQEEERRLSYVALTRAREALLLSGSFWSGQKAPRAPSPYLLELAEAELVPEPPGHPAGEAPDAGAGETMAWPADPLGRRRARVERAAEAVRAAAGAPVPEGASWARDLELLLAERAAGARAGHDPLPERIPASGFHDWIADPVAVRARLRRPMPQKPYRATRVGTRFHAWVEQRFGLAPSADLVDAAEEERDDRVDIDETGLARLREAFERSEWAGLAPAAVETEIHLPFDGRTIVCKLDAVFRRGERWQVVDWKTGRAPRDEAELQSRQLQLALYRLAWARHAGVDPADVDVAFFFVAEGRTVVPDRVLDEGELLALWRERVTAAAGSPG